MSSESHIIKEATLRFNFQKAENILAIPDKVENWFFSKALGEMNMVFDELSSDEELVEIEELVIDLGKVSYKNFDADLHIIFKDHLRKQLKLQIQIQKQSDVVHPIDLNVDRLIPLLIGFLDRGFLSWKAGSLSLNDLQEELIQNFEKIELVNPDPLVQLLAKKTIQQRLAFNFSTSFIYKLVRVISKARSLEPAPEIKLQHVHTFRDKLQLLEDAVRLPNEKSEARDTKPSSTRKAKDKGNQESIEPQTAKNKEDEIRQVDIYIANAGVVIIHPFLQPLFSNLGLLAEDMNFMNKSQREKGIWLLHYACTGNLDINEADSVFLKLLCGLAPQDNLLNKPLLTKAEKEEVNVVLNSIISYWDVLKNTSIAALRETFLLREGHIRINKDSVELIVEQKGVDMLLGHLPWALSQITFPWSSKRIYVHWA